MCRLLMVLGGCWLVGCGGNSASGGKDDAQALQGKWKLVSCVADGESQTANMMWAVEGDRYSIRADGNAGGESYTFQLDTGKKQIDVHHHDTPPGTYGGKFKGIYQLQGDSLKLCYDLKGQRYPAAFDASSGSGQVIYQLQRE